MYNSRDNPLFSKSNHVNYHFTQRSYGIDIDIEEKHQYRSWYCIDSEKPYRSSVLKIPSTSMRVDRFASCENIIPRFQTPLFPLPPSE